MYFICSCVHAQSCLSLCKLSSPPGSSVPGVFQARILEWVAISYSRGSSRPRDWTCVLCIGRHIFFYRCVTWEACTLFEYWQIKVHLQKSGLPLASEEILGYLANVQKIRLSKCSDTDMYCFFCVCVRTTLGIREIPVLHFMLLPLMLICCN